MTNDQAPTRCGYIAVVGAPNVGKSTLVNRLVGSKVSIVSHKVQTTRTRVLGICLSENSQIVLMDTPGIFEPRRRLDRAMVASAWSGSAEADRTIVLIDCSKGGVDKNSRAILKKLNELNIKPDLVLNKIDLVKKPNLLQLAADINQTWDIGETFMVSAENGDGVDELLTFFAGHVPDGPWMFPEDQISDMPLRLLAAEITREKLYEQLHEELPYASTVETESWEEFDDGSVKVRQIIYIERDSQKGIVLGKKGSRIKALGEASRFELEEIIGTKVHLFLFIKVKGKWGDDPDRYREWNLDFNA
ncbi:MAG: GTPase Era [Rhodospirillales bacterium]|jgi:GTPase|nr:GTPase Era [Rhodospirillales bacterium]